MGAGFDPKQFEHLGPVKAILGLLGDIKDELCKPHVVVIKVEVDCKCQPQPPSTGPAYCPPVLMSKGDSHMKIRFFASIAAAPSADTASIALSFIETPAGASAPNPVVTLDMGKADDGSYNVNMDVEQGSNVEYWANAKDASNNASADSVHGVITNASDTTPPPAPAQPTVGAGDTAPVSTPMLKKGVKI